MATNRHGKSPINLATLRKTFECRHLLLKFQRERAGAGSVAPSATPGTPRRPRPRGHPACHGG